MQTSPGSGRAFYFPSARSTFQLAVNRDQTVQMEVYPFFQLRLGKHIPVADTEPKVVFFDSCASL